MELAVACSAFSRLTVRMESFVKIRCFLCFCVCLLICCRVPFMYLIVKAVCAKRKGFAEAKVRVRSSIDHMLLY